MLFHLGVLWRLNEMGILRRLDRISSVSGGSITAAKLGLAWNRLDWVNGVASNFVDEVVASIRRLAGTTIDVSSILLGGLLPGTSASRRVVKAYRKHLFGKATLQDLPDENDGAPRFVINATNVQTGSLWRFSRPYMADWQVGRAENPNVLLALAVGASSAFPPVLSPTRLKLAQGTMKPWPKSRLGNPPFTTKVVLTDGGIFDNLGLEAVFKRYQTVVVSDAGGQISPEEKPAGDWARHSLRITNLLDRQVRALRKREILDALCSGRRKGVYWRMSGEISDYSAPDTLPCPPDRTRNLAETATRLAELSSEHQERLINWGYALADAGIRTYMEPDAAPPPGFPYPEVGV
jgi:NTE family protein